MKKNEILSLICEDKKLRQLLFAAFEVAPRPFQFFRNNSFVWQDGLVLGGENLVGQVIEGVMRLCCALLGAKDQTDGRVFARLGPVLAGIVEVEVHLAGIGVAELANLQVGQEQATQAAMEEDEIDAKPVVVEAKPPLTANEGEIVAQLQQEIGEVLDERCLQVRLGVFIFEVEEFEYERVFDGLFWLDCVSGFGGLSLLEHRGFIPRKCNAFVELTADLAVKLAH